MATASNDSLRLFSILLQGIESADSLGDWLASPLKWFLNEFPLQRIAFVESRNGDWRVVAQQGTGSLQLPVESIAKACDQGSRLTIEDGWIEPMMITGRGTAVLIGWFKKGEARPKDVDAWSVAAESLKQALDVRQSVRIQRRKLEQKDRILSVAADWHSHHALPVLLEQIARAAAELLNADRASIFLWDKPSKQLVGHPALGVEGQPLRVPEDAGIAGRVLRTLLPCRWDRSDPSDAVDRRVDVMVNYRTDSLIAVPLLDQRNKAIGVFEVLNHRQGAFSEEDEHALIELARHAAAALTNTQQIQQLIQIRDRLMRDAVNQIPLIGHDVSMDHLRSTIQRVANTDLAVLLLGENGTGKEVVSRQIHYQSRRRHEPFVAVNCAALTETLLESELFGHEKGAFTDAHEARAGKFEAAAGGTLFLDEIGDMSPGGQAKLLRVLEEKVVVRVGGSTPIPVDVRIVAATNQDLVEMVRAKKFREDLYFRLTVVTLNLPPLRQRGDDILELAEFFLDGFCKKVGRAKPAWTTGAQKRLKAHHWPGNIRELRNLVERIVYLVPGDTIEEKDLDFVSSPKSTLGTDSDATPGIDESMTLADATDVFQQNYIEKHIERSRGNMTAAAQSLGLQRSNLYRKMKQLGMKTPE